MAMMLQHVRAYRISCQSLLHRILDGAAVNRVSQGRNSCSNASVRMNRSELSFEALSWIDGGSERT